MMTEMCVCAVLLALCALLCAKTAREVLGLHRDKTLQKAAKTEDSEVQKRLAAKARREMSNFMNYDGKSQEDNYVGN